MYSYSSVCSLGELYKSLHNGFTWHTAVNKEKIMVVEASICKTACIIDLLVEPDNGGDIMLAEVGEVSLGGMEWVACG